MGGAGLNLVAEFTGPRLALTGGTTVEAGKLIASEGALPADGDVQVDSGGTLELADAGAATLAGVAAAARQGQGPTVHPNLAVDPGALGGITAQDLQQLGLAIAADAGKTQDLSGADVEADAAQTLHPLVVDHPQVAHLKHRGPGPRC